MQKSRRGLFITVLLLALLAGGVGFLMFSDITPPQQQVEQTLPHETFQP